MISRERLATYLKAVLNESEWRERMLRERPDLIDVETAGFDELRTDPDLAARYPHRYRFLEAGVMAHEGELEQTEDERCRHLANFVAFTWVELNDQAKKGGATAFDENYLPTPNDPKYESAWNASAWYFGLTGQDFSALVCEALTRLQGRGDEVVTI